MHAIEIHNLTKKFNGFTAVDNVSFEVSQGEIFGFLGPNGAGKTTTISMLSTLLKPSAGSATVAGHNIETQKDSVRKSIGVVFQDPSLDDELTGRENLDIHGRLYGLSKAQREKRISEVLDLVELKDKADELVKTFSGGMKRRLEISRGLMHLPKVLFLDEPTIGLDPQTRRKIWEHIKKINQSNRLTIILTTHYMDEADFLCNRIAIIDHGKIIALNTPEKLKEILGGDIITLESSEPEKLSGLLVSAGHAREVKNFDGKLNIVVANGNREIPKIIELAARNGISINSVLLKRPSLEDVFIHYTGKSIREEGAGAKEQMRQFAKMRFGR